MKWVEHMSGRGKIILLIVLGVLGLFLVFLGAGGTGHISKTENSDGKTSLTSEYIVQMENKIRTITEQITGSDRVQVMVRVASGSEYIYVSNEEITGDSRTKKYLTVQGESGTELILLKEIYPPVEGVTVVCEGGDDPTVQAKLIRVLTTALGITSNRICIAGNKSR